MIGRLAIPYFLVGFSGIIMSCATMKDPSPDDYLNQARELIQSEQYQLAKLYIDSVQILFPQEFSKIREGMNVMREVSFAEQKRTLSFCDSMLKVRQNQLPEATKNFVFQKDAEYETIGHYVYKTQLNDQNYGRTYLQTKVDEKGRLVVTSYYCGSRTLNHTRIKVTCSNGLFAESLDVPRDGALNYSFRDDRLNYEIVRFNSKSENGIVNFVLTHMNEPVSVMLLGQKDISYKLNNQDKQALKSASDLSVILSDITRLLNDIHLAQAKLQYLLQKEENSPKDKMQ
jgi:hypothetical protein